MLYLFEHKGYVYTRLLFIVKLYSIEQYNKVL